MLLFEEIFSAWSLIELQEQAKLYYIINLV